MRRRVVIGRKRARNLAQESRGKARFKVTPASISAEAVRVGVSEITVVSFAGQADAETACRLDVA